MDSLNQSTLTPNKTRLSRTFAKVLHTQKTNSNQKVKHDKPITELNHVNEDENLHNSPTMDAFIAKVFAATSSVKAAYARMQVAQSPYNPEGIQSADQIMVNELKRLSEFKQLFFKKHLDDDITLPNTTKLLAEIQEQKNLVQMYELTVKKLDSRKQLQDSEIIFLKEKLNETRKENKIIERRLNSCNSSRANSIHSFLLSLQQTMRSIKGFVKVMMKEMEDANWDLNAAAGSIKPDVVTRDMANKCFAFESFVCRVMFEGFNNPGFSILTDGSGFDSPELKSLEPREYGMRKPNSIFAKYCWLKYLKLIHPKMEFSLFGNLNQRNVVSVGKFPDTTFFASFANVARRVWLLHCLVYSFDSNYTPSVFRVSEGSQFTEVYMESVNEEPANKSPEVGFTVVPGFKVGGSGTVIQCQVYLT